MLHHHHHQQLVHPRSESKAVRFHLKEDSIPPQFHSATPQFHSATVPQFHSSTVPQCNLPPLVKCILNMFRICQNVLKPILTFSPRGACHKPVSLCPIDLSLQILSKLEYSQIQIKSYPDKTGWPAECLAPLKVSHPPAEQKMPKTKQVYKCPPILVLN